MIAPLWNKTRSRDKLFSHATIASTTSCCCWPFFQIGKASKPLFCKFSLGVDANDVVTFGKINRTFQMIFLLLMTPCGFNGAIGKSFFGPVGSSTSFSRGVGSVQLSLAPSSSSLSWARNGEPKYQESPSGVVVLLVAATFLRWRFQRRISSAKQTKTFFSLVSAGRVIYIYRVNSCGRALFHSAVRPSSRLYDPVRNLNQFLFCLFTPKLTRLHSVCLNQFGMFRHFLRG